MSEQKNGVLEVFTNMSLAFITNIFRLIAFLPAHLVSTIPYYLGCVLQLDKVAGMFGLGKLLTKSFKSDPEQLEKWYRERYQDSENFFVNFNLKQRFKDYVFNPSLLPSAHVPVPPNLERGLLAFGRVYNGQTKDDMMTGWHFNPTLNADAYAKTADRAATASITVAVFTMFLALAIMGPMISVNLFVYDTWGSAGSEGTLSISALLSSSLLSIFALAIAVIPFVFIRRYADCVHDAMALNETLLDIQDQLDGYGGREASKEEVTLSGTKQGEVVQASEVWAKQRAEFWRVFQNNEPMIYLNRDDGTALARCGIHGYEKGTPIKLPLNELNQNMLATGKIGSGKTTGIGLPVFERIINSFMAKNYPVQGMGLDGKATLNMRLQKILKRNGKNTDNFIPIGVKPGQYGIPIFHGKSPVKNIDILASTCKGEADPFFVPSALQQMLRVMVLAHVIDQTPMGADYYRETRGCSVYSPEWVQRICNNPDLLYKTIEDLMAMFEREPELRAVLLDGSLKSAIQGLMENWRNMLKAEETASSVISTINVFLSDFTSDGRILEYFGQGRRGSRYKELALCFQGYFFFSALADTEFGEASRKINIFARASVYNLLTLREIEFREADKDPQASPVIIFIDEHHLMASSGTTGLSDASILNISRSMGLVFLAMTQSQEAYEPVLGKAQTENMVQQMLNRAFLPTKSDSTAKWVADNSGRGYEFKTYAPGVAPSEGVREIKNGGVITLPRTKIRSLSRFTPVGLPTSLDVVNTSYAKTSEKTRFAFSMSTWLGVRFNFSSGVEYISAINSPGYMQEMKLASKKRRTAFAINESIGVVTALDAASTGSTADIWDEKLAEWFELEGDQEIRSRAEGVNEIPLFSGRDLIDGGNPNAIVSYQQFGVEHWCRTPLEPIYI